MARRTNWRGCPRRFIYITMWCERHRRSKRVHGQRWRWNWLQYEWPWHPTIDQRDRAPRYQRQDHHDSDYWATMNCRARRVVLERCRLEARFALKQCKGIIADRSRLLPR